MSGQVNVYSKFPGPHTKIICLNSSYEWTIVVMPIKMITDFSISPPPSCISVSTHRCWSLALNLLYNKFYDRKKLDSTIIIKSDSSALPEASLVCSWTISLPPLSSNWSLRHWLDTFLSNALGWMVAVGRLYNLLPADKLAAISRYLQMYVCHMPGVFY